jgi:hypothetical protein
MYTTQASNCYLLASSTLVTPWSRVEPTTRALPAEGHERTGRRELEGGATFFSSSGAAFVSSSGAAFVFGSGAVDEGSWRGDAEQYRAGGLRIVGGHS